VAPAVLKDLALQLLHRRRVVLRLLLQPVLGAQLLLLLQPLLGGQLLLRLQVRFALLVLRVRFGLVGRILGRGLALRLHPLLDGQLRRVQLRLLAVQLGLLGVQLLELLLLGRAHHPSSSRSRLAGISFCRLPATGASCEAGRPSGVSGG
jgi:hypothetical protein